MYESMIDSAVVSATSVLQSMTDEQLQELLQDDEKVEELLKDLPQFKSIVTEKELLQAQNKSLATANLNQEPVIREGKEKLLETYEEARKLKDELDEKKSKLNDLVEQRSLGTTLALLLTAAAEAEEESERIKELMMDSELPVDDFLKQFLPKRTLGHMRRVKAEKMRDIVRGGDSASSFHGRAAPPPPSGPAWGNRAAPPKPPSYDWNYTGTM